MQQEQIIRIDGKPYKRICVNPCEYGTPLRSENIPLELEYGRWYKCDEVMPEEIMEHHHWDTSTTTGLVVAQNQYGQLRITNRYNDETGWHWVAGRKNFKRWLALPPIKYV